MTSPPHPDRSCWIQLFVWIRLDSILPAWSQHWHMHTLARLCRHTPSMIKVNAAEEWNVARYDKRRFFAPFVMMSSSIQNTREIKSSELNDQTAATSLKICQVGRWCFFVRCGIMQTADGGGGHWYCVIRQLWQRQVSSSFGIAMGSDVPFPAVTGAALFANRRLKCCTNTQITKQ